MDYIKSVYKAFGQDGGTIHQLADKVLNNNTLLSYVIVSYLFYLMGYDNRESDIKEIQKINGV